MRMLEADTTKKRESIEAFQPGISREGGTWYAHLNKREKVSITPELAHNINTALRTQGKVEDALFLNRPTPFLKIVSLLNCRKTIATVLGKLPLSQLKREAVIHTHAKGEEDLKELSGEKELYEDIEQLLASGHLPTVGTAENLGIGQYLEEHPFTSPAVVHVFDVQKKYMGHFVSKLISHTSPLTIQDVKTQLHRNHSFLVLGRTATGSYICFQKRGPSVLQPFELRSLSDIISSAIHLDDATMYASFIEIVGTETSVG